MGSATHKNFAMQNFLVDSYGWIEYFSDGQLAEKYARYIEKANTENYITPSVVLYEVYKKIKKENNEEKALEAYAYIITYTKIIPLDEHISIDAAERSIEFRLGMADSIIVATAEYNNAKIVTSDKHLKELENVLYIE